MKRVLSTLCALVPSLLLLPGCSRNTFVAPPPPQVTVQRPSQRDVTVYEGFPGNTEARDSVEVRARVRGYLDAVHFKDGEFVEADQKLFTIEPELYQSSLDAAEAALAQAEAARQLADATFMRKEEASKTGAVSELDMLTAAAERDSAEAAVKAAEAEVASRKLDLSYTEVLSPVAGRIGRRLVSEGNLVGGLDSTLLTTVVVQDPLHVYFNITERVALYLFEKGATHDRPDRRIRDVFLELANGSRYELPARPDYLDPTFDQATGTLLVRAEVSNPKGQLMPGMFVRVLIPGEVKDALLVPELAIQRDQAGPYLLTVDAEGMVDSVYVKLGPQVEAERIIREGLKPEDRVIISGIQRARPGIQVDVQEKAEGSTKLVD